MHIGQHIFEALLLERTVQFLPISVSLHSVDFSVNNQKWLMKLS